MKGLYGFLSFIMAANSTMNVNAQGVITIDQHTQRYIGETSAFDRGKYLNAHIYFPKENADFEKFKKEYNLSPDYIGARTFSTPTGKHKMGKFPPVQKTYSGQRQVTNLVVTGHPKSIFYDEAVDYSQEDINPFVQKASVYAVDYFKYEADIVPRIFEPFNEPMVHAKDFTPEGKEGKYNTEKIEIITTKICEYHRDLARAIHATPELSGIQMYGYGSAFPQFEDNDFSVWENRYKKFIDIAGADMDGFSVHLYDGSGVNNKDGRRSGSNTEAIMDLIEAYSAVKLGQVKPIAITEYGRLVPDQPDFKKNGNYVPLVNAQAVRSQIHMMFNFIERGDNLAMSIPFTVGQQAQHTKYSKSGLWVKQPDGTYEYSQRIYFFEIWKDVKGDRVRINTSNIDVQSQAFVDGKQLFVVLNNLNDETQQVKLDLINSSKLSNVGIKRLKMTEETLPELIETSADVAPRELSIEYGETIVLTYNFKSAIKFDNAIRSQKYYATDYMQPITANRAMGFTFNHVKSGQGEATLRLSLGRDHDMSLSPKVLINDREVTFSSDVISGYDQKNRKRFFGTLEIPVPIEYIKAGDNKVSVMFEDNGGHVSSAILQVETLDKTL